MEDAPESVFDPRLSINGKLSEDLIFRILQLLSPEDLLCGAALVCYRWAALIKSDAVWRQHLPPAAALSQRLQRTPPRKLFPMVSPANLLKDVAFKKRLTFVTGDVDDEPLGNSPWEYERPIHEESWCENENHHFIVSHRWKRNVHGDFRRQGAAALLPAVPPSAGNPFPSGEAPGMVAASYERCHLHQFVNLVKALRRGGLSTVEAEQYLDTNPPLEFSVCVSAQQKEGVDIDVGLAAGPELQSLLYEFRTDEYSDLNSDGKAAVIKTYRLQANSGWHRVSLCLQGHATARLAAVMFEGNIPDEEWPTNGLGWSVKWNRGAVFAAPLLTFVTPSQLPTALQRHGQLIKF